MALTLAAWRRCTSITQDPVPMRTVSLLGQDPASLHGAQASRLPMGRRAVNAVLEARVYNTVDQVMFADETLIFSLCFSPCDSVINGSWGAPSRCPPVPHGARADGWKSSTRLMRHFLNVSDNDDLVSDGGKGRAGPPQEKQLLRCLQQLL